MNILANNIKSSNVKNQKLKYYNNLDGIRAIAALMVMAFHFFSNIEVDNALLGLIKKMSVFGQTGVTLFFVLSGFLITRILIHTKTKPNYFKNFYLRRTLRIFPLYYLFLIISYYLMPFILKSEVPNFNQQIFHFIYLQNFALTFDWNSVGPIHFWSLAVEEHFYLFWPLIIYLFSPKNLTKIIIGIILGTLILRIYMLQQNLEVFYFTFTRFDSLAIGSLLALIEKKESFAKIKSSAFLKLMGAILLPTIVIWVFYSGTSNNTIQALKYLLLSTTYFFVICYTLKIKENNLFNRLLTSKVLTFTGQISYGLYVYHPLAYYISNKIFKLDNILVDFMVKLIFSYLISSISYFLFEKYFLKLKKYFEYSTP